MCFQQVFWSDNVKECDITLDIPVLYINLAGITKKAGKCPKNDHKIDPSKSPQRDKYHCPIDNKCTINTSFFSQQHLIYFTFFFFFFLQVCVSYYCFPSKKLFLLSLKTIMFWNFSSFLRVTERTGYRRDPRLVTSMNLNASSLGKVSKTLHLKYGFIN